MTQPHHDPVYALRIVSVTIYRGHSITLRYVDARSFVADILTPLEWKLDDDSRYQLSLAPTPEAALAQAKRFIDQEVDQIETYMDTPEDVWRRRSQFTIAGCYNTDADQRGQDRQEHH